MKTKETHCPICECKLDDASAMQEGTVPKPGDVTICLYCQGVLEFDENMDLIEANYETLIELDLVHLSRAHRIVNKFHEIIK